VSDCLAEVHHLDERLSEYDRHVSHMAAEDERSRRLMQLQGIADYGERARLDRWQRP